MSDQLSMKSAGATSFSTHLAATATRLAQIARCAVEANRLASEVVWAHTLNDTVRESDWFVNRDLLPHQYASGHQTLYVLYRILNEGRPLKILCVGQGLMSQVVNQYERSCKGVEVRKAESGGDFPFDLVCIETGQVVTTLPQMRLSEHGTIIIDDAHRMLKNDDVDKYADLIHEMDRTSVVGRYEGLGMCYVVTGKDKAYLASM